MSKLILSLALFVVISAFYVEKSNQAPTAGVTGAKSLSAANFKSAKQELEDKFPQLKDIEENVATIAKDLMKSFFDKKTKRAAGDEDEEDEADEDLNAEDKSDSDDFVEALLDLLEEFEIMETSENSK